MVKIKYILIFSLLVDCNYLDTTSDDLEDKPVSEFSIIKDQLDINEVVLFNNTSMNGREYTWDFGDGTTSRIKSPNHSYKSVGNYTVILYVKSNYEIDTSNMIIKVDTVFSIFEIASSYSILFNKENVQFSNKSTGSISKYEWNFGTDELVSTEKSPKYRFTTEGSKTITLKVTGNGGSESTYNKPFNVYSIDPSCNKYSVSTSMSRNNILNLRKVKLQIGEPRINNDHYEEIRLELYHPDNWLREEYIEWPTKGAFWVIPPYFNGIINDSNKNSFTVGDDWGIKITYKSGSSSCIKTLRSCTLYTNNQHLIILSHVY